VNFSTPDKVASVILNLKDAEKRRAPNRALIDSLFNGSPPYTQSEAEENKIQWNVNWGEGSDLLLQGREQLENAHLSTDFAFTVQIPEAPKSKTTKYAHDVTWLINRLIRGSRTYFHTQRSKWGSVILHGPGSQMWFDTWAWKPDFVGIDDLLIPTDTELPLESLNHFAVRRRMTPGQLFRKTFGKPDDKRDPSWVMDTVKKVLNEYKDVNQNQNSWNWADNPEKMAELWKQNSMYYETDAVPTIWLWDFYYQDDSGKKPCWYRKILLDNDCVPGRDASTAQDPIIYLYDSKRPHAQNLDQILHIQFIDGNNVPPFMYHSCRGLGMRLHDAVHALNRLRCQLMQKVFEDMMMLFRAQDPIDRSRLDKIYLGMNYGVVPEGLSFVTRDQRYTPDVRMIEMQLANLKQLVGEGSQQYTQDIDAGTNKERTAFEVSTLLNQTTRLTGSMLNLSYIQEAFAYKEICRRLTLPNTPDWDARKFQNDCLKCGIPKKWIDAAKWEIEPVRVLGSGNPQLEQAQAQAMLQIRPMLNPQAQNEVMHDYVFAITHDPKRANRLAPLDAQPQVTDSVHDTEIVFGALMGGSMVRPKQGLIALEVCGTMIQLMELTLKEIMSTGAVGTPAQAKGLRNSIFYTEEFVKQLSQDETQKEAVKMFTDRLSKIKNLVKAMMQRQQQAMEKSQQNGDNAEMMAKIQAQQALTQQKLQSKQMADQMKLQQKEMAQRQKMMHRQQEFATNQRMKEMESLTQVRNDAMMAAAEAANTPPAEEQE
jgi:hypothetical protein